MDLIPTLLLTLVATYCVARWTLLWRTGRRDGVSRGDTLYAAICFAVGVVLFGVVGMFGLCSSRQMLPLVSCALQLPALLFTAAIASIGAPPQSRRTLGHTWLVIVAGCAFAIGSCFAVL
ncbi:MAG: hypothetical protein R3F29_11580 [Planctomycetota bacterium]